MTTRALPTRPDLEYDKKQAKRLKKAQSAGEPEALARIREHHPAFREAGEAEIAGAQFALSDAQLVIAREYGLPSWPQLKAEIAFTNAGTAERVRLFTLAACHRDTGRAHELLAREPALGEADLQTACIVGNAERARALLDRDPGLAARAGGPMNWPPIVTLCRTRLHFPGGGGKRQIAKHLLARGADPNSKAELPMDGGGDGTYESSVLFCAVTSNQPGLAKELLEAGAQPDEDSMYHACELPDLACLKLLLQYGGDPNGRNVLNRKLDFDDLPGVRLLVEHGADPNRVFLEDGTTSLIQAARRDRGLAVVKALLGAGADPLARAADGSSAFRHAARLGNREVADHLAALGAGEELSPADRLVCACAAGDRTEARGALAEHEALLDGLEPRHHAALCDAAGAGRLEAVELMLELGFPVDAMPPGMALTALNSAAWMGYAEIVGRLLEAGADPEIQNDFGGTALGAALHGAHYCHDPRGGVTAGGSVSAERLTGYTETVALLLSAGARVEPDFAEAATSLEMADLLRAGSEGRASSPRDGG